MPGFLGGSGATSSGTGGEIKFPKEFIDPVTKLRISNPENLIDTDFEYGLQPTKWETVELINNTPSFFSKSGDTTIPGIQSITTNAGTREITVTTGLDHGLDVGIPINVQGTKSVTADGSYIINSIPDTKTFTYLAKSVQASTLAIEDLYTSIITGEFFQGSQLRIADADGIVTDAASVSTLTVTTESPHGFGPNTPFYFLNLNSTISQEFEAANTAAKSFDASNSATAQTFDGSNTLSTLNIDWSNSATVGGTVSNITSVNTVANTISVDHTTENFSGLPLGTPLYYDVQASLGYFLDNPRGVVFLNSTNDLDVNSSTFSVSTVPDGDDINLQSNLNGTFQIANQARSFAGYNVTSETETVIDVARNAAFKFEGANDQAEGGNGDCVVESFSGSLINVSTDAGAGLDYYQGAMVLYSTTGGAASGLSADTTYFIDSFFSTGTDTYAFTIKELPTDENPISVSGGSGTQSFARIGVSTDKDIIHIKDSFFAEKDMLEYSYPVGGAFEADEEKNFYFVATAYDEHNYKLNPVAESFISATGGDVVTTVTHEARNYTVHRFVTQGSATLTLSDAGTFGQNLKYVVNNGSFDGDSGSFVEDQVAAEVRGYSVVVNSGGEVAVAYPQDGGTNDIPFNVINPVPIQATGGSISDFTDGDGVEYRIHAFASTGTNTFSVSGVGNISSEIDTLIVAGGGSGGSGAGGENQGSGGGGGAGGLVYSSGISISAQNYSIVVGNGGAGRTGHPQFGIDGGNSSAFGLTALGGGGGGRGADDGSDGRSGGSGGGGGNDPTGVGGSATQPGSASGGFGNAGGTVSTASGDMGGGGGGAGQAGTSVSAGGQNGFGGDGLYYGAEFGDGFGENGFFAGGGGGGTNNTNVRTAGGNGGGGDGGVQSGPRAGLPGQANTGGGGGGGSPQGGDSGSGGSGIVLVRYRTQA